MLTPDCHVIELYETTMKQIVSFLKTALVSVSFRLPHFLLGGNAALKVHSTRQVLGLPSFENPLKQNEKQDGVWPRNFRSQLYTHVWSLLLVLCLHEIRFTIQSKLGNVGPLRAIARTFS